MNYTPVPSTFYQPALHSTSFQSLAPNHQQLVPFFKKRRCSYCYYSSDRAFDLKKHQTRKSQSFNKQLFLCGNCELITSSVDKMIKHKKDVYNIIWNGGHDVKEKGDVREGSDVIKNRAWNHSNFKERGYESYF